MTRAYRETWPFLALFLLMSGCHGGGGDSVIAPPFLLPHVEAQLADLEGCFKATGKPLRRPARLTVETVQAEGWVSGYPIVWRDGKPIGGLCRNSTITLVCDGDTFSQIVLRHEIGHAFQYTNGLGAYPVHPAQLAPCLPDWYDR